MLKPPFKSLASSPNSSDPEDFTVLPRDAHGISRKQISKNALTVMYELQRAGFEAYLVGGGVRDLLLGSNPKDFDVATNATPEQVQSLFKRARMVGRRFKIVHVRFGREVIEVTTFRAGHQQASNNSKHAVTNEQGMLVRDNVYGSLKEDALRRDFTVNALYYSIDGFTVLDYTGGINDLENRTLRIIGDPEQRYREDPVRMLRAARFAAKLDFTIEAETAAAISQCASCLEQVSSARLFDETIKLFLSGQGLAIYEQLQEHQLFTQLFPYTAGVITRDNKAAANGDSENGKCHYETLVKAALASTDERIAIGKPVTPAFILAAMLWPVVAERANEYLDAHTSGDDSPGAAFAGAQAALMDAAQEAIELQLVTMSIPRRFTIAVKEIWTLQARLTNTQRKRAKSLVQHPRFRAAYDFLLLREQAGESLDNSGQWWTDYQKEHPVKPRSGSSERPKKRRRRPRRKNTNARASSQSA